MVVLCWWLAVLFFGKFTFITQVSGARNIAKRCSIDILLLTRVRRRLKKGQKRRAFSSQNQQNTSFSDRFWKLGCGTAAASVARNAQNVQGTPARDHGGCEEMARRCGAARMHLQHTVASDHFSKFGWKNCMPLWREARVQFQNRKKDGTVSGNFL